MKEEIIQLLFKIFDSDISKDAKEQIVVHYILPRAREGYPSEIIAPIEQEEPTERVGL